MASPWRDARGVIVSTTPTLEGRPIQEYLGIVTGEVFFAFPHAVMIITTALAMADQRLYEAAAAMRASPLRTFFTVTLPGCRYGVSRNAFQFTAAAADGTFDVLQQSDPLTCGGATQDRCVWTARADVDWIRIVTTMPRAGDDRVTFTVAANGAAAARTGHITVRDKVITVAQAGR